MFPIALDLTRIRIALVGTGDPFERRLKQLRDCGATEITVYADRLPGAHEIRQAQALMVVGLDNETSAGLARLAREQKILVNVEDKPDLCDFHFMGLVQRGDLTLAVSTGGASPTLTQGIKAWLAGVFGEEWADIVARIGRERLQWKKDGLTNQEVGEKTREYIKIHALLKALPLKGGGLGGGDATEKNLPTPSDDPVPKPARPYANAIKLRSTSTEMEQKLWHRINREQLHGYKFRRQHPIGHYIADFVCMKKKLIVEVDGSQHAEQQKYDEKRTAFLETEGYKVLRFWNSEVAENIDGVVEVIMQALSQHASPPSLSFPLQGEGDKREVVT